jgi:hypothetical protein
MIRNRHRPLLFTIGLMLSAVSAAQAPAPVARGSVEDMNRALRELNADGQGVPDIRYVPRPDLGSEVPPRSNPPSGRPVAVPKSFRVKEVSLNTPAREGLAMSEAWSQTPSLPAPGPDGRVLYVYGEGLPTLVCAPLRLCVIELEAGERLVGDPQIGRECRAHRRWRGPRGDGTSDREAEDHRPRHGAPRRD